MNIVQYECNNTDGKTKVTASLYRLMLNVKPVRNRKGGSSGDMAIANSPC